MDDREDRDPSRSRRHITVEDDGPGIAVEGSAQLPPALEWLTKLSRMATLDGHKPHAHFGPGMGLCPVNALGSHFELVTVRAGKRATLAFQLMELGTMRERLAVEARCRPDDVAHHAARYEAPTGPIDVEVAFAWGERQRRTAARGDPQLREPQAHQATYAAYDAWAPTHAQQIEILRERARTQRDNSGNRPRRR